MSKTWVLIDNVDTWFNECLQGQSVPQTILDAVGAKFSAVPRNVNATSEAAYYPVLVRDMIWTQCSLALNLVIVRCL